MADRFHKAFDVDEATLTKHKQELDEAYSRAATTKLDVDDKLRNFRSKARGDLNIIVHGAGPMYTLDDLWGIVEMIEDIGAVKPELVHKDYYGVRAP